jgi:LytS/YehU family sensor histidine kinase
MRRLGAYDLRWFLALAAALAASLVGSFSVLAVDGIGSVVIGRPFLPPQARAFLTSQSWLMFLSQALVYLAHVDHKARRARELQARAETMAKEARLETLRTQLNPHFLFNAINSIVELIEEDGQRAQRLLIALAELLRRSMSQAEATVPLAAELELAACFIEIQKARFEDDLRVDVASSDPARVCAVPAFFLQGLIENAIKHGMASSPSPLRVRVDARVDQEALIVRVSNTGHLRRAASDAGGGIGLTNLRARLQTLFPARHRFELTEHDGWVHAELRLDSAG